jgi:alpha-mannosidase
MSLTCFELEYLKNDINLLGMALHRDCFDVEQVMIAEPVAPSYDCPADELDWNMMSDENRYWGGKHLWSNIKGQITVPQSFMGGAIDLIVSRIENYDVSSCEIETLSGPEGQLFINGQRIAAIDRGHDRTRYDFKTGETYDIRIGFFSGRFDCYHQLASFKIVHVDMEAEKLYYDMKTLLEICEVLEVGSEDRVARLDVIKKTLASLDFRNVSSRAANCSSTSKVTGSLRRSIAGAQSVFDGELAKNILSISAISNVSAVGHGHIDLGWLWEIAHTHHKCIRTFATQCSLLERYDRWIFNQSSPQAYAWVEKDAPELFEKIKGQISMGRWEADGAMWCEADTNIPSGESLIRQFFYGKKYFKNKLGVDSRLLWLPDVFGYTAALPQLMKLAEVDGLITSKISWNQYNRFPYDCFKWKGLDGSEIPVQVITTPHASDATFTYNAGATAVEVKGAMVNFNQKKLGLDALMSYGWGDGGGGVDSEMIERLRRMEDFPACPQMPGIINEKSSDLMKRVLQKIDELPCWDGELYLEYHRGTYTTQGWLKRANRRNEINLHNAEWLGAIAGEGFIFDKETIDTCWEDLLLCQFHDILPGSSVKGVYEEVMFLQDTISQKTGEVIDAAIESIAADIDTSDYKEPVVLFNTLSWDRTEAIKMPDGHWRDDIVVSAGGWCVVDASEKTNIENSISISDDCRQIESRFWKINLGDDGSIIRLYDKQADREVLRDGQKANHWQLFEDRPLAEGHDAWDIDLHYQKYSFPDLELESVKQIEHNSVRAVLELCWRFPVKEDANQSVITQQMVIYANNPKIDFQTQVDWFENHTLLKAAFAVDIRTNKATYEVQFGHIERPTHHNTSWDMAKFEVCAHRFADLGEFDYGVSLLNDCKYGYDTFGDVIRLSCIKSAQYPDETADQGKHCFTYSLLPHQGSFQQAGVVQSAAEMNNPLIVKAITASSGTKPARVAMFKSSNLAVIIDTTKPAEDGFGTVVRIYESYGSHSKTIIKIGMNFTNIQEVNLMEKAVSHTDLVINKEEKSVTLTLKPFQIVSLKF